jgi:anti-sigma factor RsiW
VQRLLGKHVDGRLSSSVAGKVREHLDSCPDCAARLQQLEQFPAVFRDAAVPMPPLNSIDAVVAAVLADRQRVTKETVWRTHTWLRWATWATCGAALLAIGLHLGSSVVDSAVVSRMAGDEMPKPHRLLTDAFEVLPGASPVGPFLTIPHRPEDAI